VRAVFSRKKLGAVPRLFGAVVLQLCRNLHQPTFEDGMKRRFRMRLHCAQQVADLDARRDSLISDLLLLVVFEIRCERTACYRIRRL